jgi:hypothetical protein
VGRGELARPETGGDQEQSIAYSFGGNRAVMSVGRATKIDSDGMRECIRIFRASMRCVVVVSRWLSRAIGGHQSFNGSPDAFRAS